MKEKEIYIAILRGINVSGKNMIKMPALVKTFESLGFEDVRTYVQSGNILFKFKKTDRITLEKQVYDQIDNDFGFAVPVMVLEADEVSKVRDNNPFLTRKDIDPAALHVTFLSEKPGESNLAGIDAALCHPDEYIADQKAIYLFCPDGYGRTKLNNNFFENKLKLTATTRNWNTVNKLVELSKE